MAMPDTGAPVPVTLNRNRFVRGSYGSIFTVRESVTSSVGSSVIVR